ncbi:peptidase [Gardnerella pickettii]|uniref:peptidase n=1 Tax=Gardnerella pickettii TaxID=2914924 RepID=UPI0039EE0CCA
MTTKSGKHTNKIAKNAFDSAANNGVIKAVDMRKVAALSAGAAGVIAGAAIAFGATPAMAAETSTPAPVNADSKKEQSVIANKDDANKNDNKAEGAEADGAKAADNKTNADSGTTAENAASAENGANEHAKSDLGANQNQGEPVLGTDRGASTTPESKPQANSTIELSKDTKDTLPNMYAWGKSDNVYIESGQNQSVTFKFAKPDDGSTITKVAIFPSDTNGVENTKSRGFLEYYSDDLTAHKPYSGEYSFTTNQDGSATLTMSKLYRDNNMAAEKYAANRCVYVYGKKDGKDVLLYKTNIARAATLVPPKTAGSIVLQYDEQLTDEQIRAKLKTALDAPTEAKDGKSLRDQITAASKSFGVGGRTGEGGKFVQTPDAAENKVVITDNQAYAPTELAKINKVDTSKTGTTTTYVTGAQKLKTYLISDLGYKSDALPLTVARYDTRIDKPIVDEVDITKLTDDQKADICKKLANLNHVTQDKVTFNDKGEAVINFDGVDEKDAPKIALKDLVLKKFEEKDIKVPANDKATVVYNPLGYSKAELARIKQSIIDANKDNTDLGLTSPDQITLEYITGDTVTSGHGNQGISNGMQENTITVKIKTDKAYAEFTSDVTKGKLTRLVDIRKDYDVSWKSDKTKIDGRDTDEGISWGNDSHTTIIYRYDPTAAKELKTEDIVKLLKAIPKDGNAGLRDLTGGEKLDREGKNGKDRKSHAGYVLKNDEPTGELSLGNMSGAYWIGNQKVDHSDEKLGDEQSIAGSYTWDPEAGSVTVAGKKDKIYKARLFVLPYELTHYKRMYLEQGRNPGNTAKAINVIFVPQTNHKKSDLSKSIGEHKITNIEGKDVPTESTYYNASDKKKEAYDEALKQAKEALKQAGDTEDSKLPENLKALIDNATINLNKARAELDGDPTNKDGLEQSINDNGKAAEGSTAATPGTVTTDKYKNVTDPDFKKADGKPDDTKNEKAKAAKKAYDEALQAAKELKDDDNATQKAVDAAKAKLDAAREKLNDFTTNKDELNAAIAADGKVNTGKNAQGTQDITKADPTYQNSTPNDRKAYDDAVAEADRVSKDPNASQKEVNEAIAALQKAKAALDAKATDKSKLAAAEKQSFDNPSTDASKQSVFYKNALNKQTNGTSENEKQAAKNAIDNYNNALTNARTILNNEKATQAQVDEAKKKLEEAENALHENYKSDDNDLTKAIANNVSGYLMPAYFNAFDQAQKDGADSQAAKDFKAYNDAYQKAKELSKKLKETEESKKPKQTEIDAAKTALEEARKVIDKYATDTSKISAALLHSLAITNSPAYKNASAGAEGSDEAKAKAAYDAAFKELQKAFNDQMDKDKGDDGNEISESVIPDKNIDMTNKDALKKLQAHAKGQPLNRDVTKLLAKLNDAVKGLDKFKTKTDELIKSINKDSDTHPSPAFKNAATHQYLGDDGNADSVKNAAARKAASDYGQALNEARDLLKDPTATQAQVNAAKKKLDDARKALDTYKTDTTKLKESVKKHGSTDGPAAIEGTVTSDAYRNASDPHFMKADATDPTKLVEDTTKNEAAKKAKADYDKALVEAQDLLNKADPKNNTPLDAQPTQQQINDALKKLDEKRQALEAYKTVTTALETEANKSTAEHAAVTEGDFEYTPEFKNAQAKTSDGNENADVTAYKEALKKARNLVKAAADQDKKNSSHPTQKQINDALDALKAAKKQITDNYKTNLEPLTSAKDFADGDFKKTPEYQNALAKKNAGDQGATQALGEDGKDTGFDNILKKVAEKLNDEDWKKKATQKQVNALLKQLQDAKDKIAKEYKTDAIKLENEVGDKDQDGKPVTPPFEASVAYKNALEKAKAESKEDADKDTSATKKLAAYAEKLAKANELIEKVKNPDPNAKPEDRPTQAKVDEALKALQEAKNAIKDAFTTKVDALKKETKELKDDGNAKEDKDKFENSTEYKNALAKKGDSDKDIEDVQTYKDALKKANDLLNKFDENGKPKPGEKDIPSQKEVDEAQKSLKEIKDKILANYKTDKTDLNTEAGKDGDFAKTPEFQNAAGSQEAEAYKNALDEANKVLGNKDATQAQVDEALKKLKQAKDDLTRKHKTDKNKLYQEKGNDPEFRKSIPFLIADGKDIAEYNKALNDANAVLADPNATQAQVDEALRKLQAIRQKIIDFYNSLGSGSDDDSDGGSTGANNANANANAVDKSMLHAEVNGALADVANGAKGSKGALVDASVIKEFNDALENARRVLADPNATQEQVEAATMRLRAARAALNAAKANKGSNSRGNMGVQTGVDSATLSAFAAVFVGLAGLGVSAKRRKHSSR